MYIAAHLHWTGGFPLPLSEGDDPTHLQWQPAPQLRNPDPAHFRLEREHLHRASRAYSKLIHRFPHALPKTLDNYDEWVARVPQLLDLCKLPIHEGKPLPKSLFEMEDAYPRRIVARAKDLADNNPELASLIDAFSWTCFLKPGEMPEILTWLESYSTQIRRICQHFPPSEGENDGPSLEGTNLYSKTWGDEAESITFILLLWRLSYRDGQQAIEPLLTHLSEPLIYGWPINGFQEHLSQWRTILIAAQRSRQRLDPPIKSFPTIGEETITFARWLSEQPKSSRRRTLNLMALIRPAEGLLPRYKGWWARTNLGLQKAKGLIAIPITIRNRESGWHYRQATEEMIEEIAELKKSEPSTHFFRQLFRHLRALSLPEHQELVDALLVALPYLPQYQDERYYCLLYVDWYAYFSQREVKKLPSVIRAMGQTLAHFQDPTPFLKLWIDDSSLTWDLIYGLEENKRPLALKAFYHTWQEMGALSEDDGYRLIQISRFCDEAAEICAVFRSLAVDDLREKYLNTQTIEAALAITPANEQLAELVRIIHRVVERIEDASDSLMLVNRTFEQAGWHQWVYHLLMDGSMAGVVRAGDFIKAIESLEGAIPEFPVYFDFDDSRSDDGETEDVRVDHKADSWWATYPTSLQPTLKLLDQISFDAKKIAQRVLAKDLPSPKKLQQEMVVIQMRLEQLSLGHLAAEAQVEPTQSKHVLRLTKRLDNLQQRLENPKPLSPVRIERLQVKLARATRHALLERWIADLRDELYRHVTRILDIIEIPAWLLQPRQLSLLAPILQMEERPMRQLAIELLQRRCEPPPWSLVDHPANQAYLERITKRGINIEPWIQPPGEQTLTAQNGRQVVLSFADDPLDIVQMGEPFSTCLSPGDFNFFSVFANAADINKHVIYLYDAEEYHKALTDSGTDSKRTNAGLQSNRHILARCLIALTDHGHILTFHPYCHDDTLGFEQLIVDLVADLASRMKTNVHDHGQVPTLVASDWYDDGPVDLLGRFDFLNPGSPFRRMLKTIAPDQLVPHLEAAIAPNRLHSLILVRVLHLEEVAKRPELVLPLLPLLQSNSGITDEDHFQAIWLAFEAGKQDSLHDHVREYVRNQALPTFIRYYRRHGRINLKLGKLLVLVEPPLALRALRQTRPKGVKKDEDEREPIRRKLLAQAYEALNRPERAKRMRESG